MTTPAYFGAMSMWFTEKPPRAMPQKPSESDVTSTPVRTSLASGMSMSETAAPQNPACATLRTGSVSMVAVADLYRDKAAFESKSSKCSTGVTILSLTY